MTLAGKLRAWASPGRLLQPYDVKPLMRQSADRIERLEAALREIGEGWDGVPGYNRPSPEDQITTLRSIATAALSP